MDYTNLNDVCPKDSFPLHRIDQIVDASAGHGMLSFMDAFSGYHQKPIYPPDMEKTSFITPHGLYCYNVMPFGLKNAGAIDSCHSRGSGINKICTLGFLLP